MNEYDVLFLWHDEGQVWTAENDEIPFIIQEKTLERLMKRVPGVAAEMLEINGKDCKNANLNYIVKGIKAAELVEAVA